MWTDTGLTLGCTKFPADENIPIKGRVKFGIDPTLSRLHLGHLVPMRVVRKFQDNGHPVTIVLGTFTARLGDPSGRDTTRPILTREAVQANADKIRHILDRVLRPGFTVWENGELHDRTSLHDFLLTAANFTVSHMLSRDAFKKRQELGNPIGLHELLVPVCQGLDSVHLHAQIEVGGQDQLFNFQVSRTLQELHGIAGQVSVMTPIINGTDGRKMSKSFDNCIFLDDPANDVFGKVMSIPDSVMVEWIPLLSDEPNEHEHPMQQKLQLAWDVTKQLHGEEEAGKAWDFFEKTVQNQQLPDDIKPIYSSTLIASIVAIRSCSKAEARRLIESGGVSVDGVRATQDGPVELGQVVKVGRRDFGKVSKFTL